MTTESLGRALRYTAAYRPLLDTPELKGMLRLLDKLAAGDGGYPPAAITPTGLPCRSIRG